MSVRVLIRLARPYGRPPHFVGADGKSWLDPNHCDPFPDELAASLVLKCIASAWQKPRSSVVTVDAAIREAGQ